MSQSNVIMAFRKRLKKRGYTDISIIRVLGYPDLFTVSATDPLFHRYGHVDLFLADMQNMFRF